MTVTNQTLLSDNRQIAGTTWRELKIEAMADDYQQHTWYAPLTPCERQLLGALRASQMKQALLNLTTNDAVFTTFGDKKNPMFAEAWPESLRSLKPARSGGEVVRLPYLGEVS